MKTHKDYFSSLGVDFEPFPRRSYTVIEPLPFLHGHQWDDRALAYVDALRPSQVRVVTDGVKLNACCWRVTIYVNEHNFIERIEQEVQVGLPKGIMHGMDLDSKLGRA